MFYSVQIDFDNEKTVLSKIRNILKTSELRGAPLAGLVTQGSALAEEWVERNR
jgi:hypothetical protein